MRKLGITLGLLLAGVAVAQTGPDPLDPPTWFDSMAAVIGISSVFAGAIVRWATALGKDWFGTNGWQTVALSGAISAVIAGVGGYYALGAFADLQGWQGAVTAAGMAVWAVLQANGGHKIGAHTQAAALKRAGLVQPGSLAATELAEEKRRERR